MIILNLVVLFYTGTRGAQVGFAIGIFITALIILFGGRKFKSIKKAKKVSLVIVVLVLVSYLALIAFSKSSLVAKSHTLNRLSKVASFANPITLPHKINELKTELYDPNSTYQDLLKISGDGTFTSRILNIKMSLAGFKERPILGWGQDNYFYVFAQKYDARMYAQEPWFDRSHNVFMDWLIAGGIIGLLSYLALYVAALMIMWSKKFGKADTNSQDFVEKALLTGLLIAYFVHNIFVFDNLISYILFFIVLAYISVRFAKGDTKVVNTALDKNTERSKKIIYGPIVAVGLILALYFGNIRYIQANRDLIKGLVPNIKPGENPVVALTNSLNAFKEAAKIGGIAEMESREQMAQSTLSLINEIKNANLPPTEEYAPIYKVVSDSIDTTKEEYTKLLNKRLDPRSLNIYSSFLSNIGETEEALKYSELAYQMAPMKQSIANQYVGSLILAKDYEKANQVAKKMYESDETYDSAKITFAVTDIYIKNFENAEKLLTNNTGVMLVNRDIMEAYLTIKVENRLINILKKNIEINKQDTNSLLILANVYLTLDMKNKAIETLEELKKVAPQMATNINPYIESLKKEN